MKNILNVNKIRLKFILMSFIIFVSAVVSIPMVASKIVHASYSESTDNDNDYEPSGQEDLYSQNLQEINRDWEDYTSSEVTRPEFLIFLYNPENLKDSYSQEELLKINDCQKHDYNIIAVRSRDKELSDLPNAIDNTLSADFKIYKNHPKYDEAFQLIKTEQTDRINLAYTENIKKADECHNETKEFLINAKPFSNEAYKEAWEDYIISYSENVSHLPPNNEEKDMSPSDKVAWEEFNSLFQEGGSSNPEENQPNLRSEGSFCNIY